MQDCRVFSYSYDMQFDPIARPIKNSSDRTFEVVAAKLHSLVLSVRI